MSLIPIDGSQGEGGGQVLRTALALSVATGQGFHITKIRAQRPVPGLAPQHLAAVRAATLACGATTGGAFDRSPDLRFEPGVLASGDFRFDIATAGASSLVAQTVLPPLALAPGSSRVEVTGGTHVPWSPSFHFLERHWAEAVRSLGLVCRLDLIKAGFYPPGGGEIRARITNWSEPRAACFEDRGALVALRGLSGQGRIKGDLAKRQRDGAQEVFWEQRRTEVDWQVLDVPAASPGCFLFVEAIFESGRAGFGFIGERGVSPERLGARAARRLLRFVEEESGAVDPCLADQLAVPMALSRAGGRVTTSEVTGHLESVVEVMKQFGVSARIEGRRGLPGRLEVDACS